MHNISAGALGLEGGEGVAPAGAEVDDVHAAVGDGAPDLARRRGVRVRDGHAAVGDGGPDLESTARHRKQAHINGRTQEDGRRATSNAWLCCTNARRGG
jgi:hypothetical protein